MVPVNGAAGKGALDQLPQRKYAQAPERERIAKEARAHDIGNRYQNQHPQAVLPLLAHQDERVDGILPRGEPDEGAQRKPVAFQQERQDAKADKRGDRGFPKPQKQKNRGIETGASVRTSQMSSFSKKFSRNPAKYSPHMWITGMSRQ